jgi:hypothetical protein
MTRIQKLQSEGKAAHMPPLGPGGYLVDHLWDAGPTVHTGMGPAPLSHADLAAYQANMGIELQAWEVRTLRRLSADYLAACQAAKEADAPAPYVPAQIDAERRATVSRGLKAMFGARLRKGAHS